MVDFAEQSYREHVARQGPLFVEALESVLPADTSKDDGPTELTRKLCFEEGHFDGNTAPPFSEARRAILDHGLRQVVLAEIVLGGDTGVEPPEWLNRRLLGQAMLVTDVGLSFVPTEEVDEVFTYGPKSAEEYDQHPWYGYRMAEEAGVHDIGSRIIALCIARHHIVQARNQYGPVSGDLEWGRLGEGLIDGMAALIKPFDHADDYFSRRVPNITSFEAHMRTPYNRFSQAHPDSVWHPANQYATTAMLISHTDLTLPVQISEAIMNVVLDPNPDGIGQVYRNIQSDLALSA